MAFKNLPTSGKIINEIKTLIKQKGSILFETNGYALFYSGPEKFISNFLGYIQNHERSFYQKNYNKYNLKRIDETIIGKYVGNYNSKNIYEYFELFYGKRTKESIYHADRVMRFVSREFAKSCYGHIETVVCGASLNKIFFEVELPELIKNKKIKTINGLPMKKNSRYILFSRGIYCI